MIERSGTGRFRHRLHGGDGTVGIQWYFREESTLPVAVQRWELAPGTSEGAHAHPADDDSLEEIYVVVEGTVTMRVDDATHTLHPGDAVRAPVGARHDLVNPGPETAAVLIVWGPRGAGLDWSRYRTGRASRAAAEGNDLSPTGPPDDRSGVTGSLEITLSTVEPERLAAFWAQALGYRVLYRRDPYIVLGPAEGAGSRLVVQSVDSTMPVGGLHLDLRVEHPERTVARLVEQGAQVRRRVVDAGREWTVMTDPDGNEFCVCPARSG